MDAGLGICYPYTTPKLLGGFAAFTLFDIASGDLNLDVPYTTHLLHMWQVLFVWVAGVGERVNDNGQPALSGQLNPTNDSL